MNELNLRHSETETFPEGFSLSAFSLSAIEESIGKTIEENIGKTKVIPIAESTIKPMSVSDNIVNSVPIAEGTTKSMPVNNSAVKSIPKSIPNPMPATTMIIKGRTYEVNGFFKPKGKTISEKIYGIMSKEVDYQDVLCYNDTIPQDSLTVGKIRRV